MRKLLGALLIASLNAYAIPPISVDSEVTTVGNYVQNVKLPNEQATQLTSRNTRIETGNSNLLKNPSFEHMTAGIGWTTTNATKSSESVNVVEGKKSLKMVLTGALNAFQDSTINASQLTGLQGAVSIKIKTSDVTGLKVCARNAAVTSDSLCVNVVADGQWKSVVIPFILSTTSNGIAITSTGTSGTVYIDEAFVGTSAPFQNVNGAKLVGEATYTSATFFATSSTSFVTATSASQVVSYRGLSAPQTTNAFGVTVASMPSGTYVIEANGFNAGDGGGVSNALPQYSFGASDIATATTCGLVSSTGATAGASSASASASLRCTYTTSTTLTNKEFYLKLRTGAGGAVNIAPTVGAKILVWYFPPESQIYSQTSRDYSRTLYTPTLTGFGTPASTECYHSRSGEFLELDCKATVGVATATEARFSLPTGLTTSAIGTLKVMGKGNTNTTSATRFSGISVLFEPNVQYVTFGLETSGTNGVTKYNGNDIVANGGIVSFTARIPIAGWTNSSTIVGSFEKIEKCANDYECTDSYHATISSTGIVSNERLDWINGNCTNPSTGFYTCTFNASIFTVPPVCTITPSIAHQVSGESLTSASAKSYEIRNATGAVTSAPVSITCSKTGVDYKPKTAKVASSIGVPTVPSGAKVYDSFSVSYGNTNLSTVCSSSPCFIDQIGGAISSVTRSALGTYALNSTKTYLKLKCWGSASNPNTYASVVGSSAALSCANCSALSFNTGTASTTLDTFGTISCLGEY